MHIIAQKGWSRIALNGTIYLKEISLFEFLFYVVKVSIENTDIGYDKLVRNCPTILLLKALVKGKGTTFLLKEEKNSAYGRPLSRRKRRVAPISKLDAVVRLNGYPPTAYFNTMHIRVVLHTELYVLANQPICPVRQNRCNFGISGVI